jgi:CubicO group peptidase (beta-lactamase class C family)
MQKVAAAPLLHEPGERYTYGLSTDILGYLVEVLSGQSLQEFIRTRICEPLGMEDTWFYLPEDKHDRLMNLYRDDPSGKGIRKITEPFADYPKSGGLYYSGGGGLSSTALDYAIFQQMLLNGGEYNGIRLLGRKTIDMMRSNQIGDQGSGSLFIPGHPDKRGLGFEVISLPGSVTVPMSENSFGWGGAFGSLYWMDPAEDLVVHLVLQKSGQYNHLRWKFIATVYQALE